MNEILLSGEGLGAMAHYLKTVAWSAAGQLALHGLCPWDVEKRWILHEHRAMNLPNLGGGLDGATLVHLSDLHCSPLMRERHLHKHVEMVNESNPDFVAITGDFITASTKHYARRIGKILADLQPRIATLAVLGNHDYGLFHPNQAVVRGLSGYLAGHLRDAGIHVLNNQCATFRRGGSMLHFVGTADLWAPDYDPIAAFEQVPSAQPIIALVHNPDAAPQLAALGARYVLAGHTHGQAVRETFLHQALWPTKHVRFVAGQYDLGFSRYLYINRGLGPSRRACRNTRPEITEFTLRNSARPLYDRCQWSGTKLQRPTASAHPDDFTGATPSMTPNHLPPADGIAPCDVRPIAAQPLRTH
jgi:hypothetical protein